MENQISDIYVENGMKTRILRYGMAGYSIKQDKVIAWKKMTSEAVELDV